MWDCNYLNLTFLPCLLFSRGNEMRRLFLVFAVIAIGILYSGTSFAGDVGCGCGIKFNQWNGPYLPEVTQACPNVCSAAASDDWCSYSVKNELHAVDPEKNPAFFEYRINCTSRVIENLTDQD